MTSMDIQSGALWHFSGDPNNVSQRILPADLPVHVDGLTVVYTPTPQTFWGDDASENTFSYALMALPSKGPVAAVLEIPQESAGMVTIKVMPYTGSEFQTADVVACQRLCWASVRCSAIEFQPRNGTRNLQTDCRMIDGPIVDPTHVAFAAVGGDVTVMCYAKRPRTTATGADNLQNTTHQAGPNSGYGFVLVHNGSCRTAAAAATAEPPADGNSTVAATTEPPAESPAEPPADGNSTVGGLAHLLPRCGLDCVCQAAQCCARWCYNTRV